MSLTKNSKIYNYFAITISPPHYKGKPDFLYNNVKYTLQTKFARCSEHYILYPEFSDTSRLHFHGIIRFKDKIKFDKSIKYYIDFNIGYVCIKPLDKYKDLLQWILYCKKGGFTYEPIMPKKPQKLKKVDISYLDKTPIEKWASSATPLGC